MSPGENSGRARPAVSLSKLLPVFEGIIFIVAIRFYKNQWPEDPFIPAAGIVFAAYLVMMLIIPYQQNLKEPLRRASNICHFVPWIWLILYTWLSILAGGFSTAVREMD